MRMPIPVNFLFIRFIFLGIVIALFFQCMSALLNPVYRTKKAVKWGLVTHTVTMFSVLTIGMTINRRTFSTAYIDNRGVHIADPYPSGPLEYLKSPNSALQTMQTIAFLSSPIKQWLIDGLLVSSASSPVAQVSDARRPLQLYRCYVIYSKNYWATAIPGLMYLASIGMWLSPPQACYVNVTGKAMSLSPLYPLHDDYLFHALEVSYYSISGPLNVLLTLMIIARLVLHKRNTRNAVGASSGPCGLYTAIVVALVESSSLYTFTYLLYLVPFALHSSASNIFLSFGGIQVRAVFDPPRAHCILGHCLITEADRSSVRFSSFCALQTEGH